METKSKYDNGGAASGRSWVADAATQIAARMAGSDITMARLAKHASMSGVTVGSVLAGMAFAFAEDLLAEERKREGRPDVEENLGPAKISMGERNHDA